MKRTKYFAIAMLAIVLVAAATTTTTHAYALFGFWWQSKPVTFYLNPSSRYISANAAEAAVLSAASAWSTQSKANTAFVYGGRVTDAGLGRDDRNVVIFRYDTTPSGTLGTTYIWSTGYITLETDVVLWEGEYPVFTGTSGCSGGYYAEDVATHELGHALGMDHSANGNATMYPYYTLCSTNWRSLDPDDIAGIEALYPPAAGSNTAPTISISNPVNNALATQGTPVPFSGSAADTQDGNITSKLVWRSNLDGQIGTGGSFSAAALSAGTHTITASAIDNGGMTGSGQVAVTITAACARATPTVSFTPATASVAAGTSQQYTLNVTNSDASSCGGSSFTLGSTAPGGWTTTLGTALLAVNAGASATTTMTVTAPTGTAAASYQLTGTATNSAATTFTATATASQTIVAPPPPPFTASVSTNATYVNGNTVIASVLVKNNGVPVASAAVTITMTKPNGSTQKFTGNTSNTGVLNKNLFKVGNSTPRGTYQLAVVATKTGLSGSGSTSFVVQ
jgi:hypothetical protein